MINKEWILKDYGKREERFFDLIIAKMYPVCRKQGKQLSENVRKLEELLSRKRRVSVQVPTKPRL